MGCRADLHRVVRARSEDRPVHVLRARREGAQRPRGAGRGPLGIEAAGAASLDAVEHVDVIAREIRRLDEVVQGFLKFTRPEDLKLQPVNLSELVSEVVPVVSPEAERRHVHIVVDTASAPEVNGDPTMLRQAIMNLALNACQAMPDTMKP